MINFQEEIMKKSILAIFVISALSLNLLGCDIYKKKDSDAASAAGTGHASDSRNETSSSGRANDVKTEQYSGSSIVPRSNYKAKKPTVNESGSIIGQVATKQDRKIYRQKGVVSRDGHRYYIKEGKYVPAS
jgi:hypothetical protein